MQKLIGYLLACLVLVFIALTVIFNSEARSYKLEVESLKQEMAAAVDQPVEIRVQAVMPDSSREIYMLQDFMKNVALITDGSVKIRLLDTDEVASGRQVLGAVHKGRELEAGFGWTQYWAHRNQAAMLFGSPVGGAGIGLDNFSFMSWYMTGGGRKLYEELWKRMGVNVKGFMLQPLGPNSLGWFKKPISSMDDFRRYRYRSPAGVYGTVYRSIGVSTVSQDDPQKILAALTRGVIDAADWCCPQEDVKLDFQQAAKNYYVAGAHQSIINADFYLNQEVWKKMSPRQQQAMEVAADASLMRSLSHGIQANGMAFEELKKSNVKFRDAPQDYFLAYARASYDTLEARAKKDRFFAKVWKSQKDFAKIAVPYWQHIQKANAQLSETFYDSDIAN